MICCTALPDRCLAHMIVQQAQHLSSADFSATGWLSITEQRRFREISSEGVVRELNNYTIDRYHERANNIAPLQKFQRSLRQLLKEGLSGGIGNTPKVKRL